MVKKLRIAFFSFTSCEGCLFEFLTLKNKILDLLKVSEIVHFKLIKEYNEQGPFDIAFVEGAISTEEEIEKLKKIREESKFLITLGTCATWGGIPSIKNFAENCEKIVYPKQIKQKSIKVTFIDKYVKVDYHLRGCPISKEELFEVIRDIIVGKIPREKDYCVCVECKKKEVKCLFEDGIVCLGPVTYAGCNAVCPSFKIPCDGCRGPLPDGNLGAEIELLEKYGIKKEDWKRMFMKYAPEAEKFKEVKDEPRKI